MNFSEYTLISFGDSFTFGQDTVPRYKHEAHVQPAIHNQWKKDCNEKSYTQVIADRMGFKDNLNFGIMGGSNDSSISLLETFLRRNRTMKVFVLFNFTNPGRSANFLQVPGEKQHYITNIGVGHARTNTLEKEFGIKQEKVIDYFTIFNNSIQELYNHIKYRKSLYYILTSHNIPYVSFDIINKTDYTIMRDSPMNYIGPEHQYNVDGHFFTEIYNDERFEFPEFDYIKSYCDDVNNETPLLSNHIKISDLNGSRNFKEYINKLAISEGKPERFYNTGKVDVGGHWSKQGHIKASEVLEKFINERYN
jgi:hypothetical protein